MPEGTTELTRSGFFWIATQLASQSRFKRALRARGHVAVRSRFKRVLRARSHVAARRFRHFAHHRAKRVRIRPFEHQP